MKRKHYTLPAIATCLLLGALTTQAAADAGYRYTPRTGTAASPSPSTWNGRTYTDAQGTVHDCVTGNCATTATPSFDGARPHETHDRGMAQLRQGDQSLQDGNRASACRAYRKAQSLFDSIDDARMSDEARSAADEACSNPA